METRAQRTFPYESTRNESDRKQKEELKSKNKNKNKKYIQYKWETVSVKQIVRMNMMILFFIISRHQFQR